ncbi:MAG: ribonuclease P protein component [Bacteroidota bacterium]
MLEAFLFVGEWGKWGNGEILELRLKNFRLNNNPVNVKHPVAFTFTQMPKQFAFPKQEKLKSRKLIDSLFAQRESFARHPLRVMYHFEIATAPVLQAGVTASKKHFKKAVDRNRIKRLMREAYRLQKGPLKILVEEKNLHSYLFFVFTDKTLPAFATIKEAMKLCLLHLEKKAQHLGEQTV